MPKRMQGDYMSDPLEILESLLDELKDIRTVFIASLDGFVIDGVSANRSVDLDALAADVVPRFDELLGLSQDFRYGNFNMAMIEFDKGVVLATAIGEDAVLVAGAKNIRSLGLLRNKIRNAAIALQEML